MLSRLRTMIQDPTSEAGRPFALCIQLLILISIITLSIETLPDLSDVSRRVLMLTEVIITLIFTVEYLLRLVTADRPLTYVFSFYGLIDLIAIVPFYLALGVDLRGLRAFRFFRLFRILKLARYNRAMDRFRRAMIDVKEEIVIFMIATVLLIYLAAVGIYYFENPAQPEVFRSIPHSLWWAVSTLTTVGYGDVFPITSGGKAFTFIILMLGLGTVAIPAGLVASALAKVRRQDDQAKQDDAQRRQDGGPEPGPS